MTTIQPSRPSLTSNDSAVLQALFDAESSPSSGVTINPSLPAYPKHLNLPDPDSEAFASLKQRELSIVRTLQPTSSSSTPPTSQTIQAAINALDALIAEHPTYPSAYVNRAQALRTLIDQSSSSSTSSAPVDTKEEEEEQSTRLFFSPQNAAPTTSLFNDLSHAISLSTPLSPADPVSSTQARLLADAHTHRGYLLLKAARWKRAHPDSSSDSGPAKLRGIEPDQLEEMASRDFFMGGRFGNKVAQQLAVQTNPYAKMCGAIVKEAMRKEMAGEGLGV